MQTTDICLGEKTLHLCFNGAAMFDLWDMFGQEKPLLEHIEPNTKKAFNATCIMLFKLAEQGELVRRYWGHTPQEVPTIKELAALLCPADVLAAKSAIGMAISAGLKMEAQIRRSEVDLGLQELERTKKVRAG